MRRRAVVECQWVQCQKSQSSHIWSIKQKVCIVFHKYFVYFIGTGQREIYWKCIKVLGKQCKLQQLTRLGHSLYLSSDWNPMATPPLVPAFSFSHSNPCLVIRQSYFLRNKSISFRGKPPFQWLIYYSPNYSVECGLQRHDDIYNSMTFSNLIVNHLLQPCP